MTSIHHSSIGYALSPAGKAYKVRNNPPLLNQPKSLFQVCGGVGFVWAARVPCDQSSHLVTHGLHQLLNTQLWSRVTHGPCSTNETFVSETCSPHLLCHWYLPPVEARPTTPRHRPRPRQTVAQIETMYHGGTPIASLRLSTRLWRVRQLQRIHQCTWILCEYSTCGSGHHTSPSAQNLTSGRLI